MWQKSGLKIFKGVLFADAVECQLKLQNLYNVPNFQCSLYFATPNDDYQRTPSGSIANRNAGAAGPVPTPEKGAELKYSTRSVFTLHSSKDILRKHRPPPEEYI